MVAEIVGESSYGRLALRPSATMRYPDGAVWPIDVDTGRSGMIDYFRFLSRSQEPINVNGRMYAHHELSGYTDDGLFVLVRRDSSRCEPHERTLDRIVVIIGNGSQGDVATASMHEVHEFAENDARLPVPSYDGAGMVAECSVYDQQTGRSIGYKLELGSKRCRINDRPIRSLYNIYGHEDALWEAVGAEDKRHRMRVRMQHDLCERATALIRAAENGAVVDMHRP